MKHLKIAALAVLALSVMAGAADAQKKSSRKKTTKSTSTTVMPPLEVRAAREKVNIQLYNLNTFIDKLGPIAQGIEDFDRSSGKSKPSKAASEKNDANKSKVVAAIRDLKAGLSNLESDFRTKPALQRYLMNISGITDLAAKSEDSAIAGKFVIAKDPLRDAASKLTDTLKVMPITGGTMSNLMPMNGSTEQQEQYRLMKEPKVGDGPTFLVGTYRTKAEAEKKAAEEAAKPENSNFRSVVEKAETT